MAVLQDIQRTQLRFVFENGIDDKGKMTYKNKNYNNINPLVTAEDLFSVAISIEKLQTLPLVTLERNDSYSLANEGQ
ncbi:DUF1659 domain-containing protein [Fredinandcohnia sp. QZ13]|uniref:DUF1659 domain-containing protein n=1 Tax=Fredinandcohnia sp. QZ13 TaxID=3073144 RepID=UPI00285308BD|nr:DUF1659 domain-containing protein [Fredinandcohnia sp. QZ13]MDR4890143.1 DUF1659 domain-containing protein [Fredinandcohnia sp. QZ13]